MLSPDIAELSVATSPSLSSDLVCFSSPGIAQTLLYHPDKRPPKRKLYFINEIVEDKLRRYIWTSCTSVALRDSIMEHATELIRQIIRKQNLHTIYPGQEESAFGDLVQTAWVQIEKTLYKFRARPHCRTCYTFERPMDSILYNPAENEYGIISYEELFCFLKYGKEVLPDGTGSLTIGKKIDGKKVTGSIPSSAVCPHCGAMLLPTHDVNPDQGIYGGTETIVFRGQSKVFNMWSQVARTVILAFIKKEGRDKKNGGSYRDHLTNKIDPDNERLKRFFGEADEVCKYSDDFNLCLAALSKLAQTDDRPHDGLIGKLVNETGLSRSQVSQFIRMLRLRSSEFSDSPMNYSKAQLDARKRFAQGNQTDED